MAQLQENKAQEEAAAAIDGPVIIISCPGSGKTTTLVRRIHTMIEKGIAPATILMVTFAKASAIDMAGRYRSLYGQNPGVTFATIHSLCYNILAVDVGLSDGAVLSEHDKMQFFFQTLRPMPWVNDAWDLAGNMITELTAVRGSDTDISTYEPKCCKAKYFRQMAQTYEEMKARAGRIDFDDMLTHCRELLQTRPDVLDRWQERFHYIQCDEYQDTNVIQRDILYMLAGKRKNLCVVGDDDQSIYRFRGADSSIMLEFKDDFPEAKVIFMSTNYRSAQRIVDTASSCIRYNRKRFQKDFVSWRGAAGEHGFVEIHPTDSVADEAETLVKRIKELHDKGLAYEDMAVLFRLNRQAAIPVQAMSEAEIPYHSPEIIKTLYDGWMFGDIEAYICLSMGMNPHENLMRILNRPNRFLKYEAFENVPYTENAMLVALSYLAQNEAWKMTAARRNIISLLKNFGPGKVTGETPCRDIFSRLIGANGIGYDDFILQSAHFRNQNVSDLQQEFEMLEKDAARCGTIAKWLAYADKIRSTVRNDNASKEKKGVHVSTIHRAKGQEWKAVFLAGINADTIPGKNVDESELVEEERRILYVGMTRARDRLYISWSGKECPFISETKVTLKRLYAPKIEKKSRGTLVKHVRFGEGMVRSYTDKAIIVYFARGGAKKLAFPEVFQDELMEYMEEEDGEPQREAEEGFPFS